MQFPSASKLLFMFAPSIIRCPRFYETYALSEPAKSTSYNLATVEGPSAFSVTTLKIRMAWERELA